MSQSRLMEPDDLRAIEQRCAAARPAPWRSIIEGRDHTSGSSAIIVGPSNGGFDDIELIGATVADQDFIAAARTDIPALLEEIRALRCRLQIDTF